MKYQEIAVKLDRLREYLKDLKPYVSLDTETVLSNKEKVLSVERLFQLVVDEAADINSHIAYQILDKVPESYRSSFHVLGEGKIFDPAFIDAISESARIRNQIVHDYEKLQKKDGVEAVKKFFPLYEKYLDVLVKKFKSDIENS
ncbi:MAG: DUF86 domain-containing protein [Candidatus Taylorbacteria bacterium]|nr:DUF86 domain-containing protein [Candidatus Taylorbacteria bacterium]